MKSRFVHLKYRFTKIIMMAFVVMGIPFSAQALTVSPVRVELAGDAGKVVTSEIQLFNEQKTDGTYYFSFANFEAQGETGTPSFVDATSGLATWITTPESVVLKAGQQVKIPFSIKIPEGTQPGGYFAGIFLSSTPTTANGGGEVSIGAKIGILTLLRVNGQVREGGGILSFGAQDGKKFFTSLPISFVYRFQNGGSDRVKPTGTIVVKNILGITTAKLNANPGDGNILPLGSIRKFDVAWNNSKDHSGVALPADDQAKTGFFGSVSREWHHFAFGRYSAHLELAYGNQTTDMKTAVWVFPWQLIITIIIPLLLLVLLIKIALHHYNKWVIVQAEHMLEAQHEHDAPVREPKTHVHKRSKKSTK